MASEPLVAAPSATLVDSSVLLDVLTEDAIWGHWSQEALARAGDEGRLVINPIIYAEISTGFDKIEDLNDAVPPEDFEREPLPYEAGFLAGKAFLAYRGGGGPRPPSTRRETRVVPGSNNTNRVSMIAGPVIDLG